MEYEQLLNQNIEKPKRFPSVENKMTVRKPTKPKFEIIRNGRVVE
jgi:hypothetical protein